MNTKPTLADLTERAEALAADLAAYRGSGQGHELSAAVKARHVVRSLKQEVASVASLTKPETK